jgi:hypothetical protein
MSISLKTNVYKLLRENDPVYQAMTRISDTLNIYDIKQEFIKSSTQNDFTNPLSLFNHNKGLLSDGKYINMENFFVTIVDTVNNGVATTIAKPIKYFKFKTNAVLNFKSSVDLSKTYTSKTNAESLYKIASTTDTSGNVSYYYDTSGADKDADGKATVENTYSSSPLQRLDKLFINELTSFFLYLDGIKIPDNEIFVYTGSTWTDVFIPQSYLGNIDSDSYYCDKIFNIDIRQSGSESLYYRNESLSGNTITINLTDTDYSYSSFDKTLTKDEVILFINGKMSTVKSLTYIENTDNKQIKIEFNSTLSSANVELYILNNVIYRYKIPETSMLNPNGTKVHFYIADNYITDTLAGPITKSAISFFYNGVRVDDTKIIQTSRFSYEWQHDMTSINESLIDFFVEDTQHYVNDTAFKMYSDDYYLLNMLGVKRCVDKMKGSLSYSIFDKTGYTTSFRDVLSKNGVLFDVPTALNYYKNLEDTYHSDETRIKALIADKPFLLRNFLKDYEYNSKKIIVIGNAKDINMSSTDTISDDNTDILYKIYVNHSLISSTNISTVRTQGKDIITISKSVLDPYVLNEDGSIKSGINEIELFQYDLSYFAKTVFRDTIDNSFTRSTVNGEYAYTKTYALADLPFDADFLLDDIVAIERVEKEWFTESNSEYFLVYPTSDNKGFRMVKSFTITKDLTNNTATIVIKLNDYGHTNNTFYILSKNYKVAKIMTYTNADASYMADNDLIFPIYSDFVVYTTDTSGNKVVSEIVDYIPYINNSEPLITKNGKELIYGKDYTYLTPEKSDAIACSFIILKIMPNEGDTMLCQFNSAKTNILILGYNDLDIDNKYGLVYLSELKYPVSPDYMNIFINGEKVSRFNVDILSNKLIRVHGITRPIKTLLITTNFNCKESELNDYTSLYADSDFEKLLATIFVNCDPSKNKAAGSPNVDYVYKDISTDPDYATNHGFDTNVDTVQQAENPYKEITSTEYSADTLIVMYIKWLCLSKKTKVFAFKDKDINPVVLKYFSIYTNTIIDNRMDIVVDSGKQYTGLEGDICQSPIVYDPVTCIRKYVYPGAQINLRRRFFYSMLLSVTNNATERMGFNNTTGIDEIVTKLQNHAGSKVLYPADFPIAPDKNGIRWTGSKTNLVNNL